jgi:DNA-binding MarR family transcriptional regulator
MILGNMSIPKKNRSEIVENLDWRLRNLSTSTVLAATTIARKAGMGPNELKCAEILVRLGPMSAGELAEKAGLSTGAITGIVDRLENAGWAKRIPDSKDRRRVIIQPGPQDTEVMAGLYEGHMKSLNELVENYSDNELLLITDFIDNLIKINLKQAEL